MANIAIHRYLLQYNFKYCKILQYKISRQYLALFSLCSLFVQFAFTDQCVFTICFSVYFPFVQHVFIIWTVFVCSACIPSLEECVHHFKHVFIVWSASSSFEVRVHRLKLVFIVWSLCSSFEVHVHRLKLVFTFVACVQHSNGIDHLRDSRPLWTLTLAFSLSLIVEKRLQFQSYLKPLHLKFNQCFIKRLLQLYLPWDLPTILCQ
jgi:hypothetical protein